MARPGEIGIQVDGIPELLRSFDSLPGKLQTRALRSALAYAGRRIRATQRQMAKQHKDSGNLVKSIGTKIVFNKRARTLSLLVGPRRGFPAPNGQPASRYAWAIEMGWHGQDKDPFIARSGEQSRPYILADMRIGVGKQVERLAARGKL